MDNNYIIKRNNTSIHFTALLIATITIALISMPSIVNAETKTTEDGNKIDSTKISKEKEEGDDDEKTKSKDKDDENDEDKGKSKDTDNKNKSKDNDDDDEKNKKDSKKNNKKECGGGLTVKLNLKYSKLSGKYYKKVVLRIGDAYKKVHNWSDKPSGITVKHLDIKNGKKFEVHVDNYGTDDGEQIKMKNSPGCGQEKGTIKVP